MDYITRHYKTLSENLQRKLALLEMSIAQATPPAGTSPTGPMGPPSPAPGVAPATPPAPAPGPGTSPTYPPGTYPPPPSPANYPGGSRDPNFAEDYRQWLRGWQQLPSDDPARKRYGPGTHPIPQKPKPKPVQRPGGGTVYR